MADYPADSTRARGQSAESLAAAFLRERGLTIIAVNVDAAGSEIDLIARDERVEPTVVFVEVRSRRDRDRGSALETIGKAKRRHLIRAATAWLVGQGLWEKIAVRFDVVGVTTGGAQPEIEWVPGAFEAR